MAACLSISGKCKGISLLHWKMDDLEMKAVEHKNVIQSAGAC